MVGPDRRAARKTNARNAPPPLHPPPPKFSKPSQFSICLPRLYVSAPLLPLLPTRPNRRDFTSIIAHFAHFSSHSSPFFPASSPPFFVPSRPPCHPLPYRRGVIPRPRPFSPLQIRVISRQNQPFFAISRLPFPPRLAPPDCPSCLGASAVAPRLLPPSRAFCENVWPQGSEVRHPVAPKSIARLEAAPPEAARQRATVI